MTITVSVIDFEHVNASWTTLSLIPFKKSLAGSTFSRELSCQNTVANMLNITSEMRKILANLVLGSRNELYYTQKMKFSIKDFFSECKQIRSTEEILNEKLHFLCSVR